MANENIHEFARSKRGVYPDYLENRVESIHALTKNYLAMAGVPSIKTLGESVGASASSTISTRIKKGTLTLKDMILIQRKYPVDWTSIVAAVAVTITDEEVAYYEKEDGPAKEEKRGFVPKTSKEDREAFLALMRNGSEGQTQWMV